MWYTRGRREEQKSVIPTSQHSIGAEEQGIILDRRWSRRKKGCYHSCQRDRPQERDRDRPCNTSCQTLLYDEHKIEESVLSIRSIMTQEDVIGKLLSKIELDTGLILEKVSCPIGVIGVVFESRPDALVQISALCLRSGNTVLLKGGSEAKETNEVLAEIIDDAIVSVDKRFECLSNCYRHERSSEDCWSSTTLWTLSFLEDRTNLYVRSSHRPHPGPWACGWHLSYICR